MSFHPLIVKKWFLNYNLMIFWITIMTFKFIDLFAGVGGFHFAMDGLAQCVFASEWDKYARQTYLANWGEELKANQVEFAGDITKVDYTTIPDFDIMCAGFPCQPFSIAGKQLGFTHETQGTLFFNLINIIKTKQPRVVFLENVKNLKNHDKGNTFKVIVGALEEVGYHVHHAVLNGKTHGNVPQNRERIFIVAFKNKKDFTNFSFPEQIDLNHTIANCLETTRVEDKFYQTNMDSPAVKKMVEGMDKSGVIYQYRRYYMRENKTNVCPTLTANMGTGGHNVPLVRDSYGVRKLTPRECFNFQGFPETFVLPEMSNSHLYKQAGNSVVMPVVRRIAQQIIATLNT
jgi:DNA (cytosine-5)-methyltransferase 1